AIDTAVTATVVLLVGVQGDDLVAEESCRLRSRMSDQRLLPGEFELEHIAQESFQLTLDLFGLLAWPTEAEEESSGPGELHPQAFSDPDGRLSPHPALMIQSPVESRSARGPAGSGRVAPADPASGLRCWSDASTVCISAAPT